jgi:hypothetical protein
LGVSVRKSNWKEKWLLGSWGSAKLVLRELAREAKMGDIFVD